jgi:hypothetical protein
MVLGYVCACFPGYSRRRRLNQVMVEGGSEVSFPRRSFCFSESMALDRNEQLILVEGAFVMTVSLVQILCRGMKPKISALPELGLSKMSSHRISWTRGALHDAGPAKT